MKQKFHRSVNLLLVVAILCISCLPFGVGKSEGITIDSSASSWAVPEIQQAYADGLTYPGIMMDFKRPITRQEFCTIAVLLYQKLTGQTVTAGSDPFTDTSDPEIIKAYQLGIVKGTGPGQFSPGLNITRQEICVMIFNALDKAIGNLNKDTGGQFPFDDQNQIAAWALDAMKFAYKNQIMSGVGNNLIDPLSNTTREQAIALIKRTYEAFKSGGSGSQLGPGGTPGTQTGSNATVPIGQVTPPLASQMDRFMKVNLTNRLTNPKYDTRLKLFAATGPGKPNAKPVLSSSQMIAPPISNLQLGNLAASSTVQSSLSALNLPIIRPIVPITPTLPTIPILPTLPVLPKIPQLTSSGPVYSNADCGAFIDQNGDQKRWFSFGLKNASGAANVLWQVSKTPFTGFPDNWKQPPGLVASGQVSAQAGEFTIDFGALGSGQQTGGLFGNLHLFSNIHLFWNGSSTYQEIPKAQRIYYVRAVPVDSGGNCIGDPGAGLAVLYGKPLTAPSAFAQGVSSSFELWAAQNAGQPSQAPVEFPNNIKHLQSVGSGPEVDPYWFQFKNFDAAATQVVMQVATQPFSGQAAGWDSPAGLAYSQAYSSLPVSLTSYGNNIVPIKFSDFGPTKAQMQADQYLNYYVRAVALKPSATPGCMDVSFSETITVKYGYATPVKIYATKNVTVASRIPDVKILHYEPVQWEDPDWAAHYYVFRAPQWSEINCKFKNSTTELFPYSPFTYPNTTPQQYQQQVIPTVLVQGTKVQIVHEDQDKSWWEDLWDSIVNFFSDLVDAIKGIVNWVSQAYNDLKTGLINFVANAFPIASWRDALKTALTALVDTGLAAMGIPPELPNFDQLTSMSLDYMAEVALDEAGVPADQITKDVIEKTASGLADSIASSANSSTPNPINEPFLKADPDYLDRPAYIDVQVSNPYSDVTTMPGSFNIDAKFEYDGYPSQFNSISLDYEDWGDLPTDQQFADAISYESHFWNLLKGEPGYPKYWWIYEPVRGQEIPSLQPGESRTVRIYLKEYVGKPYPGTVNADTADSEDWANLYWKSWDNATFNVYTSGYDLSPAKDVWLSQGHTESPDTIYTFNYDRTSSGGSFQRVPCQAYTP
ncbi:MAG: S-layer homology domain-containing protein [Thermacetogeniaceae bacterium]